MTALTDTEELWPVPIHNTHQRTTLQPVSTLATLAMEHFICIGCHSQKGSLSRNDTKKPFCNSNGTTTECSNIDASRCKHATKHTSTNSCVGLQFSFHNGSLLHNNDQKRGHFPLASSSTTIPALQTWENSWKTADVFGPKNHEKSAQCNVM